MRCPKCHYLSFDSGERCRNCGYEFSLTVAPPQELELPVAPEPEGPLAELSLADREGVAAMSSLPAAGEGGRALERPKEPLGETSERLVPDLPLFRDATRPDLSRGLPRPTPRPPLAVRRAPPVVPRGARERSTPAEFRLDLEAPSAEAGEVREAGPEGGGRTADARLAAEAARVDADLGGRVLAALLDAGILLALDAAIVHLTLRVAALAWNEIAVLPWIPLVAFLVLVDGAYSVVCTGSGGQTLGKMAAGIRVVRADDAGPPGFRRALRRTVAYGVSLAPAGLGLLPALVGRDRQTLHDRLAGTRVVKVS